MLQLLTQMAFFVLQHPFFNSANRPTWNKQIISLLENPKKQVVFLSKTNSILTGKLGA
jgi:hypothetical protein